MTTSDAMTDSPHSDPFHDIRPYHDDEIRPVLERLLADADFLNSIARFAYPGLHRLLPAVMRWLARRRLQVQLKDVHTVAGMQAVIATYFDRLIERTTTRLTHSGLEHLSKDKAYLFISNHRDIVMDPAFVNYMLYHAGFDTLYIAIGDNLLKRPFVTDLMRLNKSFIVRRSLKGRELLKSSKQLSEYIHHCVAGQRNVWIAQREGRAKDGVDRTDTALLKMLAMARRGEGMAAALRPLHIVPVAISYEFDPCAGMKADELYQKQSTGTYEKDEQTDIRSIVTGMVGQKGHVHVAFGEELQLDEACDDDAVAALIDTQIIHNYHLHQTHVLAYQQLRARWPDSAPQLTEEGEQWVADSAQDAGKASAFSEHIAALPEAHQAIALRMYANPLISRFAR